MARTRNRGAFTLIELLVVIAIIALLVSILVPAIGKARDLARRAVCMTQLKSVMYGHQCYAGDNHDLIPPTYSVHNATASGWNQMRWWADFVFPYFDQDAKISLPYWGGLTVGIQPADGNYAANFSAYGVVFSRRLGCPAQPLNGDYHFYSNVAYYNICYCWKYDETPGQKPFGPPAAPTTWGTVPVKIGQLKQISKFCQVWDENAVQTYGGLCWWPQDNMIFDSAYVAKSAPHLKGINGGMLDGHVEPFSTQDILTKGVQNNYPFYVP